MTIIAVAVATVTTATAAAETFTTDLSGCLHGEKAQLETTNVSLLIIVTGLLTVRNRISSPIRYETIYHFFVWLLVQRQQQLSDT